MHRFYVAPENWDSRALALRGPEAHHARDVLRMKPREKLVLFNGQGRELTAEIANFADDEIQLRIARSADATAAVPDCSRAGNFQGKKDGADRAKGSGNRRS
jgi:16S rRNA U1498 N3-methylase RsmE